MDEFEKLLRLADWALAAEDIVMKYYRDLKFSYQFLREFVVEHSRQWERLAEEYEAEAESAVSEQERKLYYAEAELLRYRLKMFTEELRWREEELSRVERIIREFIER